MVAATSCSRDGQKSKVPGLLDPGDPRSNSYSLNTNLWALTVNPNTESRVLIGGRVQGPTLAPGEGMGFHNAAVRRPLCSTRTVSVASRSSELRGSIPSHATETTDQPWTSGTGRKPFYRQKSRGRGNASVISKMMKHSLISFLEQI